MGRERIQRGRDELEGSEREETAMKRKRKVERGDRDKREGGEREETEMKRKRSRGRKGELLLASRGLQSSQRDGEARKPATCV